MKYCKTCGAQLPDKAKFCNKCGTPSAIPEAPIESPTPESVAKEPEPAPASKDVQPEIVVPQPSSEDTRPMSQKPTKQPATPSTPVSTSGKKKAIIATLIVLALLLAGVGVYFLLSANNKSDKEKEGSTKTVQDDKEKELAQREDAQKLDEIPQTDEMEENSEEGEGDHLDMEGDENSFGMEGEGDYLDMEGDENSFDMEGDEAETTPVGEDGIEWRISTTDIPTGKEMQWYAQIVNNGMPTGIKPLARMADVADSWKGYIYTDRLNKYGCAGIDFVNVRISGMTNKLKAVVTWRGRYDVNTGEDSDADEDPSVFNGKWNNGTLYATGPGNLHITRFWEKDGKQYAIGTFTWQDGTPGEVALMRP